MDKRKLTKTVVNNLVGFGIGSASTNIVRSHITPSKYRLFDLFIDVSVLATGWAVSGTVCEPVKEHTDKEIDKIFDKFAAARKN